MRYSTIMPDIGADPEFFIFDISGDKEKLIPADRVLPGKEHPYSHTFGTVFFDGVQAEINPRPSTCRESFGGRITHLFRSTYTDIYEQKKYKKVAIRPYPVVDVDLSDMEGCDRECFRFGCAPSQCVYPMKKIKYPDGHEFTKRFAGGHIHIGFNSVQQMKKLKTPQKLENLIKMMDLFAGIPSVAIAFNEDEKIRRQYYGQAGTYRIQPHGIEYRALSNFWLTSPELMSLMTGQVRDAVRYTYGGSEKELFDKISPKEIKRVINDVDREKALSIYREILEPIYKKRNPSSTCTLSNKSVRDIFDYMTVVGYEKLFNPLNLNKYWEIFNRYHLDGGGYRGILSLGQLMNRNRVTFEQIYKME